MLHQPDLPSPSTGGDPMLPQPYVIHRVRHDTRDTFTLELHPPADQPSAAAAPGQFNMLYVFGVGEVPISISSAPGRPLLHTTRAVGGVTRAMAALKRGNMVGVRGPFGTAWPIAEARGKDVVLIAGGIGLAPLRGALLELLRHRKRYGRIVLIYGTRTSEDILYAAELERLRARGLHASIIVERAVGPWRGHVGVVTALIPRAPFDPRGCVVMMCGPEIMMRFATRELQKRGVPDESIFVSLERNMKCAVGYCGHCQFGPEFICKDGPVFRYDRVARSLAIPEL